MDRKKILIASDHGEILSLLGTVVGSETGCEAREVSIGDRGLLQEIADYVPDLLVLDLVHHWPEHWETVETLHSSREGAPIPILALVIPGFGGRRRLQAWGIRTLEKPFDARELVSAVREVLVGKPGRTTAETSGQ